MRRLAVPTKLETLITALRTGRKARMKTQRHIWSVTLAGCLMDTMDQRLLY